MNTSVTHERARRPIVLIGMMGAGKSSVGRALARLRGAPFIDADAEIEKAAGRSVAQIFEQYGEAEFRRLERLVIARLLVPGAGVLSLGGGAFVDPDTRAAVRERAIAVWLKVETEVLMARVLRHGGRPLLRDGDPQAKMKALLDAREPIYAEAHVTVLCDDRPVLATARRVHEAVQDFVAAGLGD